MSKTPHNGEGGRASPLSRTTEEVDLSLETIEQIARHVVDRLRRDLTTAARTVLPQLLRPSEAADALGISERQLQILAQKDGRLRPIRISKRSVRYPVEQVDAFIRDCANNTGTSNQKRKRL